MNAIQNVKVIEATWSDIPEDAEEVIKNIWEEYGFGNDVYYFSVTLNEIKENSDYKPLSDWLKGKVEPTEPLLLHYWW